jgi:O-antigen/teichoic acid export membrane protein
MARGVAANGYGQAVALVSLLASVPFFLRAWGEHLYGEWLLLSLIPVYLAISDLGFGTAAGTEMTAMVARDDREGALSVLHTVWTAVTVISVVLCVVLVGTLHIVPIEQVLGLTMLNRQEANAVAVLLVVQVCLSQQGGVIDAAYKCDGNYATGIFFINTARLAEFVFGLAVLALGGDPWHYALMMVCVKFASYGLIWLDLRKRVPWARPGWSRASRAHIRPLLLPALGFIATPLAYAFSIQGILFAVGHLFSPAMVTVVSLHRTFARLVWQLANMVSTTAWVELSRALGAGDKELGRRIYRRSWQAVLWATLAASGALWLLARPFFEFWVRGRVDFHPALLGVFLVASVLGGLWGVGFVVPVSLNRHHWLTVVFLGVTFGSFLLSFPMLEAGGLVGGAWAIVLGEALLLVVMNAVAWRMLDERASGFLAQVAVPPFDLVSRAAAKVRSRLG